jgi:hypothetical protein
VVHEKLLRYFHKSLEGLLVIFKGKADDLSKVVKKLQRNPLVEISTIPLQAFKEWLSENEACFR